MKRLYATYCSAPKREDPEPLPAIRRYRSQRIARVAALALEDGASFGILSGSYGLLAPQDAIPWYDHLLQVDEIETLTVAVAETLAARAPDEVVWYSVDPAIDPPVERYSTVMRRACELHHVPLSTVIVVATD